MNDFCPSYCKPERFVGGIVGGIVQWNRSLQRRKICIQTVIITVYFIRIYEANKKNTQILCAMLCF